MKLGLGIDTGGTYTDGVIYDFHSRKVIKDAKSVTVKEDLKLGIINVLDQMPRELLEKVKMVSLSTTLATNACVEDKGSRAKLILMGCDKDIVAKNGKQYGLPPVDDIIFIEGGHDSRGEVIKEPDWDDLHVKIKKIGKGVDAFAVVQMWGVRNPEFEKKAKNLINTWTGLPVVCGHELASQLNFLKRAATALLNAKLIPLVNEFIDAVKVGLKERNINAPLVIVCGDGSIMSEEFVRDRPVETLLSGPAASVIGGINLSGQKNCIVVDMGGTTSDLAIVKDGIPLLAYEGANVGNWQTAVKSVDIRTIGLGGDSIISFDSRDNLTVGPRRAAPLSWLAHRWPQVLEYIKFLHENPRIHTRSLCQFFYKLRDIPTGEGFTSEEINIVKALENGPLSLEQLAEAAETSIYTIKLDRLEQLGIIMRSALTPTDIMHLTGDFCGWNNQAALMGAEILANRLRLSLDELIYEVNTIIKSRLYLTIAKELLVRENTFLTENSFSPELEKMLLLGYKEFQNKESSYTSFKLSTDFSLVGIGAPIHVYLPDVASALNTDCVIEEHAAVANAVGAITGSITAEERVVIKPRYNSAGVEGYDCFSSSQKTYFEDYEKAKAWAEEEAKRAARELAIARGASTCDVSIQADENITQINVFASNPQKQDQEEVITRELLLETTVTARAIGGLKWV
ncbi:MAG: hydantoinase/oxoprolinase family protein [Caldicoprobacterales bacterium]|jgi:N-methylhydantoinase A/oxoprolinase/acetone carboxylase beta subunit